MVGYRFSRREAIRSLAGGLAALPAEIAGTKSAGAALRTSRPPNILYLHSHDTGRFVSPYGYDVPTPNIQRLAEQGVLFRNNFCGNPTCSASRACLLTGMCAHVNGMTGLAHRGFSLNNYSDHIVNTLKKAGYTSALAGIQHVAAGENPWKTIGYDRFLGPPDTAHETASAYLDSAPEQPFFLAVGFIETHREFVQLTDQDIPSYCAPPPYLPDTPETRLDMAQFRATARVLDTKMGAVLDALDRNGLTENTLVICTTDHGIAFPRMKCNLVDGGIGVMLIMRGPGGFTGGKVIDSLVSHLDIFPTVCDVAGIERPARLEGVSLLPLIDGSAEDVRDEIFAEVNYHAAYEPKRCVRTKRWKYIRRYSDRRKPVLANCDDGPSKTVWLENGWADRELPKEALYDLVFDPTETSNCIDDPKNAAVLADMRNRLDRWMRNTNDPILKGPIPAPKGARVNDPDDVSPRLTPKIVE